MSSNVHRRILIPVLWFLLAPAAGAQQIPATVPLAEVLGIDEVEQIEWNLDIGGVELRMDQRLAFEYRATVRSRDLAPADVTHELWLWSWVSDRDDGLLEYSGPIRNSIEADAPPGAEVEFDMQLLVTPGDYTLWILLYDRTTGQHNLRSENIRVDEVDGPFPDAFSEVPVVEFSEVHERGARLAGRTSGDLYMPIRSARPLDIELIGVLSMPEHRSSQGAQRRHIDNVGRALRALSQLDPDRGRVSVSGLDLIRREVVFDQPDIWELDTAGLIEAFDRSNPPSISLDALTGHLENPVFFREYVESRIAGRVAEGIEISRREVPLKVLVFVTGFSRFADGADRSKVAFEGRCDCRVYHLRIRQNIRDLFDDINGILGPLSPRTFNLLTPEDLRKAIGEIVEDLERF